MTDFQGPIGSSEPAAATLDKDDSCQNAAAGWMTLFNEDRFHALNLRSGQRVLRAEVREESERLIGSLSGVLEGDVLTSGFSAPFGGFDLARERETPANIARLIDEALPRLYVEGARTLRVKLPPACYGESESLVLFTLLNRGFRVECCELNQHIDLGAIAGPEDYVRQLKSPARRALGKLLAQDFCFVRAETEPEWDRAYATLSANRARRGRSLALSREYLESARHALGSSANMYELFAGEDAVAAALVYRVRRHCDLVVAWGDGEHGLERSPMNLLAYHVVENALSEGVRTLDLGISNEHGRGGELAPNSGLVQFKQSVLASSETRMTLIRELSS